MKKQSLTTIGLVALGIASYAATFMQVVTKNGDKATYAVDEVSEVNFFEKDTIPQDSTPVAKHEYVDLGLPSGTLWAAYNIGANIPESYGDYFAWGETEPKNTFFIESYKWYDGKGGTTKYNPNVDTLKILLPEDDAATVKWGSEWRMPTKDEFRELIDKCQYTRTDYGAKFTGPNGNSILLPAAGHRIDDRFFLHERCGFYWTSSLNEKEGYAYNFIFGEGANVINDVVYNGFPIRAVRTEKAERNIYTVSFYTSDSILIESQNVVEGASAKEVTAPEKEGYEFVGWSDSFENVTSDLSVYALYKEVLVADTTKYEYVDLGLPSGTLWAAYNIGADSPKSYGDYFAWGETEPKDVYDLESYKWNDLTHESITDTLNNLLPEYDAATANWGPDWRMPTAKEIYELMSYCSSTWTSNGYTFTGNNYNSIFFPATGRRVGDRLYESEYHYYWTSSYEDKDDISQLRFSSIYYDYAQEVFYNDYTDGLPVRAVRTKKVARKSYTVNFYTSDSILIESQKVIEWSPAEYVKAPEKEGYEFVKWSAPVNRVTSDMSVYAIYKDTNTIKIPEHEYVDLGLPSGTLWATSDVYPKNPESNGGHFAWGETDTKDDYFIESYKWYDGKGKMSKYNPDIDTLKTLLPEDDAATVNWGPEWRMPTKEEFRELIDNCKFARLKYSAVFIGPNGNTISFYAGGHLIDDRFFLHEECGLYWTSSLYVPEADDHSFLNKESRAYNFIFAGEGCNVLDEYVVYNGLSVRAVRVEKAKR